MIWRLNDLKWDIPWKGKPLFWATLKYDAKLTDRFTFLQISWLPYTLKTQSILWETACLPQSYWRLKSLLFQWHLFWLKLRNIGSNSTKKSTILFLKYKWNKVNFCFAIITTSLSVLLNFIFVIYDQRMTRLEQLLNYCTTHSYTVSHTWDYLFEKSDLSVNELIFC